MISSAPERQKTILQMLEAAETLSTKELSARLDVTAMTIWRDITALEERGLLKRHRGRVSRIGATDLFEPDFEAKRDVGYEAKLRIARYTADHFIKEGDHIAIDGGTTVAFLAEQHLPARVTIFTNSLNTAQLMLRHPSRPSVYVCGGFLREQSGTFVGREALSFFSRRRFQRYFLSATGVDAEAGITDLTLEDNEVKQVMASASEEVVLMADQSKIGVVSHMQVMPWKRIQYFVTDAGDNDLRKNGLSQIGALAVERV